MVHAWCPPSHTTLTHAKPPCRGLHAVELHPKTCHTMGMLAWKAGAVVRSLWVSGWRGTWWERVVWHPTTKRTKVWVLMG